MSQIKEKNLPKVAIVILNYLTYRDTLNMISEIRNNLNYDNYEIIVVDNCSPNESYKVLKENNNSIYHLVKSDKNGGYAIGNNIGIRYSYELNAEYVWILNNDIILNDPDVLNKMINTIENNSSIGVVSPKVFKMTGEEDFPFKKRPSVWDMSFGYFSYANARKISSEQDEPIYRPQGCCMLLRNSDVKCIGEMDESTFLYCEEELLAERMLRINKKCYLCASGKVIHNHSKTVYSVMKKRSIASSNVRSYKIYLKKYREIKNPFIVALICAVKFVVIYIRY